MNLVMKSPIEKTSNRKLILKKETLRQLRPDELGQAGGGAQFSGGICELVSLVLSCEIVACF